MVFSVSKRSFLHRFQQNNCPQERYVACRMRLDAGFDIVAFCDPLASEVMEQSSPYRAWPGSKIKRQKNKSLRQKKKKSPSSRKIKVPVFLTGQPFCNRQYSLRLCMKALSQQTQMATSIEGMIVTFNKTRHCGRAQRP